MFSIHLLLMGACFGCVSHCFLYDLCVPLCLWCDEFVILRYVGCVVACWFVCLWFAWLCVGHVCGDACGIVGLCLVCFLILSVLCFVNVCACDCMFVVCVVFGSGLCICCLCLVHVRCVCLGGVVGCACGMFCDCVICECVLHAWQWLLCVWFCFV